VNDYQADQIILWISIGVNLVALVVLFLKGRYAVIILSLAAAFLSPVSIYGTYWHHILTEPLRWWPLIAIFRLAKPSSIWADRFYSEPKMQLARQRYPTANPVPRSLRKQAIRNLRAIERGDYSVLAREPKTTHFKDEQARPSDQSKIQEIISDGPERIGATIDACAEDPNRRHFAQALLDAALEPYFLLQLAMFANKKVNAHVIIKKWRDAGLKLPAEGTPEFFPYGD